LCKIEPYFSNILFAIASVLTLLGCSCLVL